MYNCCYELMCLCLFSLSSALACLPDALKSKLVESDEKRQRFQVLHELVLALTTTDVLKIFHDRLNNRLSKQEQNVETSSVVDKSSEQGDVLQNHVQEFNMLIHDCSGLSLNLCNAV